MRAMNLRLLTISVALLLTVSCRSTPPVRNPQPSPTKNNLAAKKAKQRAALTRCLHALEGADPSLFFVLFATCFGEVQPYSKPSCNKAWAASPAADPDVRIQLIAKACGDAYCPQLKDPKPRLCSYLSALPSSKVRAKDWTEFHLQMLVPSLSLEQSPALLARLAGVLAAAGSPVKVTLTKDGGSSKQPSSLKIVVTRDGGYVLDDRVLKEKALTKALEEKHRQSPDVTIQISADNKAPYRAIVRLMDVAKVVGFRNFVFAVGRKD
jgi:biopolymer transport protein ExbD